MSKLDLGQQKKRAKELLRGHRAGDPDAIARVAAHVGARKLVRLADAQLAIAREAGFASWARLKHHSERVARDGKVGPLERAVRAREAAAVREALAGKPAPWEAREALEHAVVNDDREIAALLLAYGAWPDHAGRRWGRRGGCLHAALLLERPLALLELLLAGGATPGARDRDGRTALAIAVRVARPDAIALLEARGASRDEASELDRALGACIAGERPARVAPQRRSDHQHACWAVRTGHLGALPALLALGCDPDVPDDDGDTALHVAIATRSLAAVDALLAAGARVDVLDFSDETPLARAEREPDPARRAALVERLVRAGAARRSPRDFDELFETAADAVVAGDLAALAALLDREPRLATAHSSRPHRATLLHYVAANGVEDRRQKSPANAGAVAGLLLARGADPDALAATYGGGPEQTPLLLAVTSVHPETAGVMADLVAALVRGGARVDGIDDDHAPIHGARHSALAPLVAAGARIDLRTAAALGLRDRVTALVRSNGTLADGAKLGADRARSDRDVLGAALRAACAAGHAGVAAVLLDAGAPLGDGDPEGMTPLHLASWSCHVATARLLLDRGASLEAKNHYGGTVLDMVVWAIHHQRRDGADYPAIVQILIDAGADLDAVAGVPTGLAAVDAAFQRAGRAG